MAYLRKGKIRFYERIAEGIDLRIPRCYYSAIDPEAQKSILLLEDLAPARPGDQLAGCSIEEAERVLPHLARLHATYWESPRLNAIPDLAPFNARAEKWQELYPEWWEAFVEKFHNTRQNVKDLPLGNKGK